MNDKLFDLALSGDVSNGDRTTLCYISDDTMGECELLIKEEGILTGTDTTQEVFHRFDPNLEVKIHIPDGTHVHPGDIMPTVEGREQSPLQTERSVLNVLQRMNGIATTTHHYQQALIEAGTKTRVLNTRKATPGIHILEREAVKIGGGMSHRIESFNMILPKGNYIDFCGDIRNAISRVKKYCKKHGKNLKIECEVRNFQELNEALAEGCNRIMFNNFTPDQTRQAVGKVNGRRGTESSGGVTSNTMIPYARAGISFISFGAPARSVKGLDMNLEAVGGDELKI